MEKKYRVTVNGVDKEYQDGITYEQIAREYQGSYEAPIVLANMNGKLTELFKSVHEDGTLDFVTMAETPGIQSYHRSAVFLTLKSFYDVVGHDKVERVQVKFSVSKGLYMEPKGEFVIVVAGYDPKARNASVNEELEEEE